MSKRKCDNQDYTQVESKRQKLDNIQVEMREKEYHNSSSILSFIMKMQPVTIRRKKTDQYEN